MSGEMALWCDEYQLYGRSQQVRLGDRVSWPVRSYDIDFTSPILPGSEGDDAEYSVEMYPFPPSVIVGRVAGVIHRLQSLTWRTQLGSADGERCLVPVPGSGHLADVDRAPAPSTPPGGQTYEYLIHLREASFVGQADLDAARRGDNT